MGRVGNFPNTLSQRVKADLKYSPMAFYEYSAGGSNFGPAINKCLEVHKVCDVSGLVLPILSQLVIGSNQRLCGSGELDVSGVPDTWPVLMQQGDGSGYVENARIDQAVRFKGGNLKDFCVGAHRPRACRVEGNWFEGFNQNPIKMGIESSGQIGYNNKVRWNEIWLHTAYSGAPAVNGASSKGIHLARVTDSASEGNNIVGYRWGYWSDGGSNQSENDHPWTRAANMGPMQGGFYINGSANTVLVPYPDTPTNVGPGGPDGAITECYGVYNNSFRTLVIGMRGFLNSDYGQDDLVWPVYSAVANSGMRVEGLQLASSLPGVRFKGQLGGQRSNVSMTGICDDARLLVSVRNFHGGRPTVYIQDASGATPGTPLTIAATVGNLARMCFADWDGVGTYIERLRMGRDTAGDFVVSALNNSGNFIADAFKIIGTTGQFVAANAAIGLATITNTGFQVLLASGQSLNIARPAGVSVGITFQIVSGVVRGMLRLNARDRLEWSVRTSAGAFDGGLEANEADRTFEYRSSVDVVKVSLNYGNGVVYQAPITKAALLALTPTSGLKSPGISDAPQPYQEAYGDGTNWRYTADNTIVS